MVKSILDSVKKNLGIEADYTAFDPDILMHINTVLGTLTQLGVGPDVAVYVESSETEWNEVIQGETNLNGVKTYVYLQVRLLFDPPSTSYAITAMQEQVKEAEWRLSAEGERIRRR